ncbi:MAG: protein kinase [Alphaproteobacteria bacterium]|nr:protein kinase [Alphaproteobacteria bacterium]
MKAEPERAPPGVEGTQEATANPQEATLNLGDDTSTDSWVGPSVLARATYEGDSIFVPPAGGWHEEAVAALSRRDPAERFSRLELLGRGGMGEVWRVLDTDLNRVIAMKILRGDRRVHPQLVARFVAEAQATAQLDHPGIVPVFELGQLDDGRLYYTMEEIRGRTLAEVLRALHAASTPERWGEAAEGWTFLRVVDVLRQVSDTVGYAHARGVIHRDLKPTNVMLGEHGEVRVVDWGLVKILTPAPFEAEGGAGRAGGAAVLGETTLDPETAVGHVAGTPGYMAPEQARGEVDRLSPAADVYALGAMLFLALTGEAPGKVEDPAATLAGVPRAPEGLRALCLEALQERPEARPENGGALASRLRAWLETARSESETQARADAAERGYLRWSPELQEAGREVLLRLVSAEGLSTPRPEAALDPVGLAALVEVGLVVVDGGQARVLEPALIARWPRLAGWVQGDPVGLRLRHQLVDAALVWDAGGRPAGALWRGEPLAEAGRLRGARWTAIERTFVEVSQAAERRRSRRLSASIAAVITLLAALSAVAIWGWRDASQARNAEAAARHEAELRTLGATTNQFLAEGRSHAALAALLAAADLASEAERGALLAQAAELSSSLGELSAFVAPEQPLISVSWARGGAALHGLDGAGGLHTWTVDSGALERSRALGLRPVTAAWSPDGARLALLDADESLWLIDPEAPTTRQRLSAPHPLRWLRFADGGARLLGLNEMGQVGVWRVEDGALLAQVRSAKDRVDGTGWTHVSLSPDGTRLWTRQHPALLTEWSMDDGRVLRQGHPDGSVWRFAATDQPGRVVLKRPSRMSIWDVDQGRELSSFDSRHDASTGLELSPDGRSVLAAHGDVLVYALDTGGLLKEVDEHDGDVLHLAYTPDGRQLLTAGSDGRITLWDAHTWRHITTWQSHQGAVRSLAPSPDGRRVLTLDASGWAEVRTPQTSLSQELPRCLAGEYGSIRPDPTGRRLLEATNSQHCLIDRLTGQVTPLDIEGVAMSVGWSPDGEAVYVSSLEGLIRSLDAETGAQLAAWEVEGHLPLQVDARGDLLLVGITEKPPLLRAPIDGGALVPLWPTALEELDGRTGDRRDWVWVRDERGDVALLDTRSGDLLFGYRDGELEDVALSEPSQRVAAVTADGEVRLLHVGQGERRLQLAGSPAVNVRFSERGGWLAVLGARGEVELLRTSDAQVVARAHTEASGSRVVGVGEEGRYVVLETRSRGIELWDVPSGRLTLRLAQSGGAFGALHLLEEGLLTDGADGLRLWPTPPPGEAPPPRSNLRLCRDGFALAPALPFPSDDAGPWGGSGCAPPSAP